MSVKAIPQFLIAAPSSNSGKTTITLGLIKALSNRGMKVQAYKCGPDYIDPILHAKASGSPSINLDTFMCSEGHIQKLYAEYAQNAEVSVVEGVMGMFDGADKMKGSSAEIAQLLELPLILVINAKAMAYSAAPLIYGFKNFRPDIKLLGVIFNQVKTESHYGFLKDACLEVGVEALGYMPPEKDIEIPGRHLGLSLSNEINFDKICNIIACSLEKTVNIDRLLELTTQSLAPFKNQKPVNSLKKRYTIAVAQDEAFCFTYYENLKVLKSIGNLVFFSPLADKTIPDCDFLYLAGGYPELFLESLSSNSSMLQSIRRFCENNGKTYAECGGMMYLGQSITSQNAAVFNMVGFLSLRTSMENPKLCLGYRSVTMNGRKMKGHEFHYSSSVELDNSGLMDCSVENARSITVDTRIYKKGKTVASYIHFYWGENQEFLKQMISGE
ncbi:MAG: cobyrinate a,c-diamide synthase [Opitutaceae bacterium]|nr:cobyrinate a,c-diamide synthase [Cytophagales bacterium]